jgi:predicted CDP-diglyceride synthetase/phosphatidate cytidylyltransferase
MEYPHWMMVAGTAIVVLGFIGLFWLSSIRRRWNMRAKVKILRLIERLRFRNRRV